MRTCLIGFSLLFLFACQEEPTDLPDVDLRREEAKSALVERLAEPSNGWIVEYQPTSDAGKFLMILDFDEDGSVRIQSDLPANNGEFYDHTIPYRIDVGLGIELVFETFGVFHYLFELDQASFGAEFEFILEREEGNQIIFRSKTDGFDLSTLTLAEASMEDRTKLSRDITQNFDSYTGNTPRIFGGVDPGMKLYFASSNTSIFWSINLIKRTAHFDIIGNGQNIEEVLSSSYLVINQTTGYSFKNGQLVFDAAPRVFFQGDSLTIDAITLDQFSPETGQELCSGSGLATPEYAVRVVDLGSGVISKNLFSSGGLGFTPRSANIYSVNIPFIFDDSLRSLANSGSISQLLPAASAFVMTYGFESDSIPESSVGFFIEDSTGNTDLFVRSIDIQAVGNQFQISLLDDYYFGRSPSAGERAALEVITDEIFEGGQVYSYFLPIQGLTIYQFYNPCNGYEFLLVR